MEYPGPLYHYEGDMACFKSTSKDQHQPKSPQIIPLVISWGDKTKAVSLCNTPRNAAWAATMKAGIQAHMNGGAGRLSAVKTHIGDQLALCHTSLDGLTRVWIFLPLLDYKPPSSPGQFLAAHQKWAWYVPPPLLFLPSVSSASCSMQHQQYSPCL